MILIEQLFILFFHQMILFLHQMNLIEQLAI
jgi:hypothetical protein